MTDSCGSQAVEVGGPAAPPPCIGITLGDPAGIGPELVLRVLAQPVAHADARLVVYGSATVLRQVARQAGLTWPVALDIIPAGPLQAPPSGPRAVLLDTPPAAPILPGQVQAHGGRLACDWIEAAVRDAQRGMIDALVTAPICKAAIHAAGVVYPGHTEMLADLTGTRHPLMFFWSPSLAVGLVTIHRALAEVTSLISTSAVLGTIRQVALAMSRPDRPRPRIGVLALNPHAGEGGLFGTAEQTAIAPAIQAARSAGIDACGPLIPDIAFCDGSRRGIDAFVAMYHDQGLIPFKMLAFDQGVNVTLGLPFCRTSPDHGTAFDIAWQGRARDASLRAAIRYAFDAVRAGHPTARSAVKREA
jgi:4-hydroxythreonine-4-phosphate dehydrogenase